MGEFSKERRSGHGLKRSTRISTNINERLLIATSEGSQSGVKKCLERGADVNCHCEDQETPLHIAAEECFDDILAVLLQRDDIVVDAKTCYGNTALLTAAKAGHITIVTALLEKGAQVDVRDNYNRTPLHIAVFQRSPEMVKLLISHGADVNSVDMFGEHILCTAIITRTSPVVAFILIKNGANVNCANSVGMTLLAEAVLTAQTKSNIDAIRMLVRRGANVNCPSGVDWKTPLHLAAFRGHAELVDTLLELGADPTARDRAGRSPIGLAQQFRLHELAERIRQGRDSPLKRQPSRPKAARSLSRTFV